MELCQKKKIRKNTDNNLYKTTEVKPPLLSQFQSFDIQSLVHHASASHALLYGWQRLRPIEHVLHVTEWLNCVG